MAEEKADDQAIFEAARRIESHEARATYLQQACGEDLAQAERIVALLRAFEENTSFLESPAVDFGLAPTFTPPIRETPATQIGPYKLLQIIGEGGMGVVYMAEQTEPVKRKVALKLIKPGMDSQQIIARFEAERQALSMMDHVNIARVLDAGTTSGEPGGVGSGIPYFVMELIHGIPITKYCDDNHLTPRQRLELFVPVCQAIQHAHQKGIIHRDIKPSNVMVTLYDGKPVPKVIDFGVAKATEQKLTERTLFTQYGTMVGTLEYMSPEQAEMSALGVDTRSDIYSLGVLLYELLTGTTPLSSKRMKEVAFAEILRLIKEEEPPKPSTRLSDSGEALASISALRQTEPARLTQLMRGELDWIVMKTLEKDRNRRYETANGFAADLHRYLSDEPVMACPPSTTYRLKKFVSRNRASLIVTSVIAVALLVGIVGTSFQAMRAEAARKDAIDQKLIAEAARAAESDQRKAAEFQQQRAEANFEKARQAVNEYFTLVSESKLFDVPGLEPLRKQLLESALRFYEQTSGERMHDPAAIADLTVTYMRVAVISHMDGDNEAVWALDKALSEVSRLRSEFPEAHLEHRRLAGYWKAYRPVHTSTSNPKDPAAAILTLTRLIGVWDGLAHDYADEPGFLSDLAFMNHLTGEWLASSGKTSEAVEFSEKAKVTLQSLLRDDPKNPHYRADLARTHGQLARILPSMGRRNEAEVECFAALSLREALSKEFPGSPYYRNVLARSLRQSASFKKSHDPEGAEELDQRADKLVEGLASEYPNVPLYRRVWLVSRVASGTNEEIDDVCRILNGCIANCPDDPARRDELAHLLRHVAEGMPQKGEFYSRILILHQQSLSLFQALVRDYPDNPGYREDFGHSGRILAGILKRAGNPKDAVQYLVLAADAFETLSAAKIDQRNGFYRSFLASTLCMVGNELSEQNKLLEAKPILNRATVLSQELTREYPDNRGYRDSFNHTINTLRSHDERSMSEVAAAYITAVKLNSALLIPVGGSLMSDKGDADRLNLVQQILSANEKLSAEFPREDAAAIRDRAAEALFRLGRSYLSQNQREEAFESFRQAIAICDCVVDRFPDGDPGIRLAHANRCNDLAFLVPSDQRATEGESLARRAIQLKENLATEFPKNSQYRFHLAHSLHGLAMILSESSREADAKQVRTEAGSIFSQLAADESAAAEFRQWNAHALWNVGDAWLALSRFGESQQAYEQSLATFQQLEKARPANPFYRQEQGFSYRKLAILAERADRLEEAEKHLRAAAGIYSKLTNKFPDSVFYREEAAHVQRVLGDLLLKAGKLPEDEAAMAEFLREQPDLAGVIAWQCLELARKRADSGDLAAAEPLFNRAIMAYKELLDRSTDDVEIQNQFATALAYRGALLEKLKLLDQAAASYQQATVLWSKLSKQSPLNEWYRQEWAYFSLGLANVLQAAGRSEDAVEHAHTGVRLNEHLVADFSDKPHHVERLAQGRGVLISLLSSLARTEEATAEVESLLKGQPSAAELNNVAWPLVSRPGAPTDIARLAADLAKKAVEISPDAGSMWNTLGVANYRAGEWQETITAMQKSVELRQGGDSADWFFLAMAHWQLDQKEEARTWLGKAIEWADAHAKHNAEIQGFRAEAETLINAEPR